MFRVVGSKKYWLELFENSTCSQPITQALLTSRNQSQEICFRFLKMFFTVKNGLGRMVSLALVISRVGWLSVSLSCFVGGKTGAELRVAR